MASEAAHEWLERYLEAAEGPTDFVLTGPATNLNWALQRRPQLASKVGRVFWMAGAVDVDGNIRDSDDDKAQESGARVGQGPRRPFIYHHFLHLQDLKKGSRSRAVFGHSLCGIQSSNKYLLVYPPVIKHGVLENGPFISDFPAINLEWDFLASYV